MNRLLLSVSAVCCLVGSAAEPARPEPHFSAVVTCFLGKIDSRSFGVTSIGHKPDSEGRWTGRMTCGWPGRVSELHWEYLGAEDGADVYRIVRRFPTDRPQSDTELKTIRFSGKRVIAFADQWQVIVFDSSKDTAK